MPLWNPEADVSVWSKLPTDSACMEPEREAARMAALKRLRHQFVQSLSKLDQNKPPVLSFERWMVRSALRNSTRSHPCDPLIPSDGHLDIGLVKDLSRVLAASDANKVATILTASAKTAAERIASLDLKIDHAQNDESRKLLKTSARTVREAVKRATESLEKGNNNDDNTVLPTALASLREATQALDRCASRLQRTVGEIVCINGSRRQGIFDVALMDRQTGASKKPYLTVSSFHLLKLLELWKSNSSSSDLNNDTSIDAIVDPIRAIESLSDRVAFLNSLYCCLARYEGLRGAGYQCAVPGTAFDAAKIGLGTTIECFASPLNCRYRSYCSAFPDIESKFGSLGSFFDDESFFPLQGSFEANPPFVPEVMVAMGRKIQQLLDNQAAKALSFLIVVPAWGAGISFCKDLEASPYLRAQSHVAASDHAFCDGAQHNRLNLGGSVELRPSSWDTAVFLLQNEAGAKCWKVDTKALEDGFCAALKAAASSVPEKSSTIERWEKRVHSRKQGSLSAPQKRFRAAP